MIGSGFVITKYGASRQIDILIVDISKPTLFKDGDLIIATPDAVRAMIEVKTELHSSTEINEAIDQISIDRMSCFEDQESRNTWSGLFVYEGNDAKERAVLSGLGKAKNKNNHPFAINSVCFGSDCYVNLYSSFNIAGVTHENIWAAIQTNGLAPAYFISGLIANLGGGLRTPSARDAWLPEDAANRCEWYLPIDKVTPRSTVDGSK